MIPGIDYPTYLAGLGGLILGLLVLAGLRNSLVSLVHAVFELLAMPVAIPARAIHQLLPYLNLWIKGTLGGLAYSNASPSELPRSRQRNDWVGWDIIGPLIYLLWFTLLALGDFWFSALGFAALLRIPVGLPKLPINLDILAGFLFVGVAAFYGFLLYDLFGATPIRRPWENFAEAQRSLLKWIGFVAIFLVCVAGIVFWIWRELQVGFAEPPEPVSTVLALSLWAILAVLLGVAAALAGWAAIVSWASFYGLFLMAFQMVLFLLLAFCYVVVRLLDAVAALITTVVDVPARSGIGLFNWLCSFGFARKIHLCAIEAIQRPRVGHDLAEPLIEDMPAVRLQS